MTAITDHAKKRIKKRIGSKHAEKDFGQALLNGVKMSQTKGDLKRFLIKSAIKHQSDAIVHKGFVFWHKKTVLITVTPLPQKFVKYIKKEKPNVAKTQKKVD